MQPLLLQLIDTEKRALELFTTAQNRDFFVAGKTEKEVNEVLYALAFELFGIRKYWHKRIVRSGKNTLFPYKENPPDLILQKDDILFVDFGPVFEELEADIGDTYVIGSDPAKIKLKNDVAAAWQEGKEFYLRHKNELTGAQFYNYTKALAEKYGWDYGNIHCGHLIGNFPHEQIVGEERINYIHPDNHELMSNKDKNGHERFWIYEIHLIDAKNEIGGFYEKLMY
jgi:Xaa-Pro aminopeptidase